MKKIALFIALISIVGCAASAPSDFYMLSSVKRDEAKSLSNKDVSLSIEVNIPGYIDRPQIVTKGNSETEYNISEFNRWLEPLKSSIERVVAENLSLYMPKSKAKASSMGMRNPEYKIVIDIDEFDGRLNDTVFLRVWWSIVDDKNKVIFYDDVFFEEKSAGTYTDFTITQSNLINKLSIVIAKKLNQL